MKHWTRITHNFNNETREWEYREELRDVFPDLKSVLGVHALDSGRWHSLDEIVQANKDYRGQYENEDNIPESMCSKEIILEDLEIMEKVGLIRSRE